MAKKKTTADIYEDDQSFFEDELIEDQEETEESRKLIIRQIQIDKYSVRRKRVELTPTMCTRQGCNFDSAERYGGFDYVPLSERALLKDVLEKHTLVAHNRSEDHIIDANDSPTQWLGDARRQRIPDPKETKIWLKQTHHNVNIVPVAVE